MPWHITNDRAECDGYAVVKDATGEIVGCHRTETQAQKQLAALHIAEPNIDESREETFSPNDAMVAEAERGLAWREEFNRGGTEIGVARARDISNRRNLPLETVNRMVSYFARHEVDKDGQGWSPGQDGYPSAGRIAWALWGGDPGRSWANAITRQNRAGAGPLAIITDIDGTLISGTNGVNGSLIRALNNSAAAVIVVTARNTSQRENTIALLDRIGLEYDSLLMSEGGDPTAYKKATAERLLDRYTINTAYENNADTRAAYRELGIDARAPYGNREAGEEILAQLRRKY